MLFSFMTRSPKKIGLINKYIVNADIDMQEFSNKQDKFTIINNKK